MFLYLISCCETKSGAHLPQPQGVANDLEPDNWRGEWPANQPDAASFIILTMVSSPSCATPISIGFPSWLASVLLLGCSSSLDHVIELRSSDAFFDEPFIIAPPIVILIVAGRHW